MLNNASNTCARVALRKEMCKKNMRFLFCAHVKANAAAGAKAKGHTIKDNNRNGSQESVLRRRAKSKKHDNNHGITERGKRRSPFFSYGLLFRSACVLTSRQTVSFVLSIATTSNLFRPPLRCFTSLLPLDRSCPLQFCYCA